MTEQRTVVTYYSNDAPDAEMNDLYARVQVHYYAIHDDHVQPDQTTVADVDGEAPPADHQWVEVAANTPPTGYSEDAAVDDAIFADWIDGVAT